MESVKWQFGSRAEGVESSRREKIAGSKWSGTTGRASEIVGASAAKDRL
jgi:hypothetical protein